MTSARWSSCLYRGAVIHHRLIPRVHRLAYRLFWLYLDLDELDRIDGGMRLLSVDRRNLVSLYRQDHGARDGSPLTPWVAARLAEAGIVLDRPRFKLLCMPRLLGYVFNPISTYYCFDGDRLRAVLCEVKNTFGAQTAYVLPFEGGPRATARPACAKTMYVSPFIAMDATYEFRLRAPGDRVLMVIREHVLGQLVMVATQTGRRIELTDRALLSCAAANLAMTYKVTAAIHLEAARLWLKGVPCVPAEVRHSKPRPDAVDGGLEQG